MWRLWAKALGEKVGKSNEEADRIAIIRTGIRFTGIFHYKSIHRCRRDKALVITK
jgi:hypothetical protein